MTSRPALVFGLASWAACTGPWPDAEPGTGTAEVRLGDREPAEVLGDAAASALAYATARAGVFELASDDDFEIASVAPGPGGLTYVRLRQRHEGTPVWGAQVAVRVAGDEVLGLSGELAPGLRVSGELRIDRELALAIGKDAHARALGADAVNYARERADLVVFPRQGRSARLAWEVELFAERQPGAAPSRPVRIVDAQTGEALFAYDAIAALAMASGPGGNERVERFWDGALEVEASCGGYRMSTQRLETVDMGGRSSGEGAVVEGALDCVGDAAANDAHGFAGETLDMLTAWMDRDSIDGAGQAIRSRVHYSEDYANAFWDGEKVTYGDGGSAYFPLSGDAAVVAHEIHHGFTENHARLVFSGQAGALNESFSDVAGVALSYYLDGRLGTTPRFSIGGDVVRESGAVLRDLCDPPRDGLSIDHADDYAPRMFIHAASGVPNKAFCLAARALSEQEEGATQEGVRRAARAWYEANAGFWTETSDFVQGCRGVLDAAEVLGYEAAEIGAIADAWAEVGVHCAQ